jgi:hypothetical protein
MVINFLILWRLIIRSDSQSPVRDPRSVGTDSVAYQHSFWQSMRLMV